MHVPATVYSTWLDAPAQGTSVQQVPPIAYLAGLARRYRLPVAGENTGAGGVRALALAMRRARAYHLSGAMYMSGGLIADHRAGVTLATLERAAGLH